MIEWLESMCFVYLFVLFCLSWSHKYLLIFFNKMSERRIEIIYNYYFSFWFHLKIRSRNFLPSGLYWHGLLFTITRHCRRNWLQFEFTPDIYSFNWFIIGRKMVYSLLLLWKISKLKKKNKLLLTFTLVSVKFRISS